MTPEWNQVLNTLVSRVRVDYETTDEELTRLIPFGDIRSHAEAFCAWLRLKEITNRSEYDDPSGHFYLYFTGKVVMLIADMGPECQLAMANEHGSGQERSMRLINNGPYTPEDVFNLWQSTPGTRP